MLVLGIGSFAQTNKLIVNKGISLLDDSLQSIRMMKSLNVFLENAYQDNFERSMIPTSEITETKVLVDELRGITKPGRIGDSIPFIGYLLNVVELDSGVIAITIGYSGIKDNQVVTRAIVDLCAKEKKDSFYFYSPIKERTKGWKHQTIGYTTFHYKSTFDEANAKTFLNYKDAFDKKLKVTPIPIQFYICDDYKEACYLSGISYKMDLNGYGHSVNSATENNSYVIVDGTNTESTYDPHDLWHARLRKAISKDSINRPVDEGCAYLYGGSWGITWPEIKYMFKENVINNQDNNWLKLYEAFYNFNPNKSKSLNVPYFINALIIQKIEKEKGFAGVLTMVSCGKYKKDNEQYFKTLEMLTGINRENFNTRVDELVNAEFRGQK